MHLSRLQIQLVFRVDGFMLALCLSTDFSDYVSRAVAMTTQNRIFQIVLGLHNLCNKFHLEACISVGTPS